MPIPRSLLPLVGLLLASPGLARAAEPPTELARKAQLILDANCHRCHGQNGAIEGGLNYITDLAKLAARKKVVPGNPEASPLYRRISNNTMPPPDEKPRPSAAELTTLKAWIESGAAAEKTTTGTAALQTADVNAIILADLEKFERRGRRFLRYFTLNHLAAAGLSDDELQTYRNALSKLVNSLSWHPKIRQPEPIDPAGTVLRIDLRWYMWDAVLWNRLLNDYPYGVLDDSVAGRAVTVATATRVPAIRADWFVATASRAPLYYDMLQTPGNLAELERTLRVDAVANIQQERVTRVGFNGSGISRFNRVLERHDSVHGAYWRTYDFDELPQNLIERGSLLPDRRNIFAFPLGPGLVETPFQHAGGEAIYALPNGLHAYILVNAVNARLDKGPIAIVSDPKRPDRAVEAGVSCMSCHVTGILPKADQVRDHLEKNPKGFNRTDADLIRGLYPAKDKSLAAMEEDGKKYAEAVAKAGAKVSRTEPVSTITLKYEADLDLPLAAAEVGLSPEEFRKRITETEALTKNLGALRVAGGTVSRQVWLQTFGDLARDLRLGALFTANLTGGILPDNTGEADPLEALGNTANGIAFSPDGRRALIAAADKSVRLWEVEGRRDLKRLIGHSSSVWAVNFSQDGTKAISGGMDASVRVWNLESAQEYRKLDGHVSLVSAVAFGKDGTKAISGGYDGAVIWWDVVNGKEVRRLEGESKYIHAINLHPVKKLAAVAGDRSVILWDYSTGEVLKKWEAHSTAVTCAKFAEDGKILLTGGDEGTVKIWDTASGKLLATLTGHTGGVRGVDLKSGGRWLISAGTDRTVRLWDLAAKREVAVFRKHAAGLINVAWLPSGVQTLSADRDLNTLIWDASRFLTGTSTVPLLPPEPPEQIPNAK